MARITYVHHYFSASYYAIIGFAVQIDWVAKRLPKPLAYMLMGCVAVMGIYTFLHFGDLTYGAKYPEVKLEKLEWLTSWNLYERPLIAT